MKEIVRSLQIENIHNMGFDLLQQYLKQASEEIHNERIKQIMNVVYDMGFSFNSEQEEKEFTEKRIKLRVFETSTIVHVLLDGEVICQYNSEFDCTVSKNKLIIKQG